MISRSQLKTASPEVIARAKETRAFERGNAVLVVPKDESKVFRLVEFKGQAITCVNAGTGEPCPANSHGQYCYHALSAFNRKQRNKKWRRAYFSNREKAA